MSSSYPTKFSSGRRKGDEYEKILFAHKALDLLSNPNLEWVRHEARELAPVDDVVVAREGQLDCYQAKHASSPHGLFDLEDLEDDPNNLRLTADRLYEAWNEAKARGWDAVRIHVYTNRAAGPELSKLLQDDCIAPDVVSNDRQIRRRQRLIDAAGVADDEEEGFLTSLRFDLRQPGLDDLRRFVAEEQLVHQLGLDDDAYGQFMVEVSRWFEASHSEPVTREDVLSALPVDTATLPQTFPIDTETHVDREEALDDLKDWGEELEEGYGAVVGPPGIGKSTLLSKYVEQLEEQNQPVLRYFAYTTLNDPQSSRRVSASEFTKSLIEQLYGRFGSLLPEEGRFEYTQSRLLELLSDLGEVLDDRGHGLTVIIDGVDHIERTSTETPLTSVLPSSLPSGVKVIFGTQAKEYLPDPIRLACTDDCTWNVPAFSEDEVARYLQQHPELSGDLSGSQVSKIRGLSEGLPLYLRYVAERLAQASPDAIDEAIRSTPAYTGDINDYYRTIWAEAERQPELKRLVGLLARLRFRIRKEDVASTLDLDPFEGEELLSQVRHLLTITEAGCRIFHDSFRQFVDSTLSDPQRKNLDRCILDYLKEREGSPAWYAHAFDYAHLAEESGYVLAKANPDFVENALIDGRPFPEILGSLRTAFDVAKEEASAVQLGRMAELLTQTKWRLDHKIDRRQLLRALIAIGDTDAALSAIATEGAGVYGDTDTVARCLIDLARFGHYESGFKLAESYFDAFPGDTDHVPTLVADTLVFALYGKDPARRVYEVAFQLKDHQGVSGDQPSGVSLLRRSLQLLQETERNSVIREIDALVRDHQDDAPDLFREWVTERAVYEARSAESVEAADTLIEATEELGNDAPQVVLAGEAALAGCDPEAVRDLLGAVTLHPSLSNEDTRPLSAGERLRKFRHYVAAVAAFDDSDQFDALRDYIREGHEWAAVYYGANADLMEAVVRERREELEDPEILLEILERLIVHEQGEDERPYEVLRFIKRDIANFLDILIETYLNAGGASDLLLEHLGRWHESEIVSFHYGIGTPTVEFSEEIAALRAAAREPRLHDQLAPLLEAACARIREEVLRTEYRVDQFLEIAEVAAQANQQENAREWLREGLYASRGHGGRKDMTLFGVNRAAQIANRIDPDKAVQRLGELADWSRWISRITDQKDPKWLPHRIFDAVLDHDGCAAANFLRSYREAFAAWKFSNCAANLLQGWDTGDAPFAYLLSESIRECTWEEGEGFRDKADARISILQTALEHGRLREAEWVAERLHRFLSTEVPPDLRPELAERYNQIAADEGFRVVDCEDYEAQEEGNNNPVPSWDDVSWPDGLTVEVEGEALGPEGLREQSETVEDFLSTIVCAKEAWEEAEYNSREAIRALMKKCGEELIQQEMSAEAISEVVKALENAGLGIDYTTVAERYRDLEDRDRHYAALREAFDKSKEWSAYSREIGILDPVFNTSAEKGMQIVMETIVKEVEDFGESFGSGTLLMKALERAGEDEKALNLYEHLRDYAASMFSSLPDLPGAPFNWTQEPNPHIEDFPGIALDIVWDVWSTPKIHRRMNLAHLVHDVTVLRPNAFLPRLVDSAVSNDADLRNQSALVLHSVGHTNPDLLVPYTDELTDALPTGHIIVDYHISEAVKSTGRNVSRSKLSTQSSRIVIQGVAPSNEWENTIWPRMVPRTIADRIVEAGSLLGWKERETLYRIEQKAKQDGFDTEYARKRYDDEIRSFKSRIDESIVPFISYPAKRILDLANRLFAENCGQPRQRDEILALLRGYDPALPWKDWNGIPKDLKPQNWDRLRAEPEIGLKRTEINQEWVTVFEGYYLEREDNWRQGSRYPCLVPEQTAKGVSLDNALTPDNYLLQLSGEQPTLTVREAQQSVEQAAGNYPRHSVRPLIGIHIGKWWFAQRNVMAVLAPDLIKRFGLAYDSPRLLNMVAEDGNPVVRFQYWQDGVRAKNGKYEPVGRGTRLTVAGTFLQQLRDEEGLHLLTETQTQLRNHNGEMLGGQVDLEMFV